MHNIQQNRKASKRIRKADATVLTAAHRAQASKIEPTCCPLHSSHAQALSSRAIVRTTNVRRAKKGQRCHHNATVLTAAHGSQTVNATGAAGLWGSSFPGDQQGGRAGVDDAAADANAGAGGGQFYDGSNGGRAGGGTLTYETAQKGGAGTGVVGPEGGGGSKRRAGTEPA